MEVFQAGGFEPVKDIFLPDFGGMVHDDIGRRTEEIKMRIERRYTEENQSAYEGIEFRKATSEIRNPDGSIVFKLEDIDVPTAWSQVASDIIAQKYFRKAGVPAVLKKVEENSVPSWLWRSEADKEALAKLPKKERYGSEMDARQVFDRLAGTWTYWGWKGGYFDREEDARAFFDELRHMLCRQMVAPNSPQWFNTGLHWIISGFHGRWAPTIPERERCKGCRSAGQRR